MNHTSNEGVTLSTDQQTVFNWLNNELQLPVYAEIYRGALNLLDTKSPGFITFVSHAGRDLMNGLPRLGTGREQAPYADLVDKLQNDWKDEWSTGGFMEIDNAPDGHVIPYGVCKKIQDLIDRHRAGRLRASETAILFFTTFLDYADEAEIPGNFLTEWKDARQWFLAHAHLRDSEFEIDAHSKMERHFRVLDELLFNAASSELERIRSLNEILEETHE